MGQDSITTTSRNTSGVVLLPMVSSGPSRRADKHLVGPPTRTLDAHAAQQVGVDLVAAVGRRQVGLGVDRLQAHQPQHAFAVDLLATVPTKATVLPRSATRMLSRRVIFGSLPCSATVR